MVWTPGQRVRLAIEKEKLEKYFLLGVTWIDPQHETKVEVLLKSNSDKEYKLRIYIPADFPNSCPALVVVQPKVLLLKNGSRLPETSDSFHTLEDTDGFHRICHFYPPDWGSDITLYQVFMKGRLWIEAYEAHLDTGANMDVFLVEQTEASDESLYESDSSSNDVDYSVPDFYSDLDFRGYSRRERLADQPPPNYLTSPFPHLSDQTLPTALRVLQSMPEPPALSQSHLSDEAASVDPLLDPSKNSEPPAGRYQPFIENKDSPPSQLSQLPFNAVDHHPNNNNNEAPILSSSPPKDVTLPSQQPLGSIVNPSPLPSVNPPNDPNNKSPAHTSPPNNEAQSRCYRPTGGVDVLGPFHAEMIRRNSSSRARPTVVPPPVKPKPKRPR